MIKLATVLLAMLLLLPGCASQSIESSYYLLRPADSLESGALVPSTKYALGTVAIAPYLDQQGLVLETQSGEIRPARHHLWAEPMYESVRVFLREKISRSYGEAIFPATIAIEATVVDVRIDQLHGTADGKAKLVAYWWLRRSDEVLASYRFAETRALEQSGYAALATAERDLLAMLATEIAGTLSKPMEVGEKAPASP